LNIISYAAIDMTSIPPEIAENPQRVSEKFCKHLEYEIF